MGAKQNETSSSASGEDEDSQAGQDQTPEQQPGPAQPAKASSLDYLVLVVDCAGRACI